LDVSLGAFFKFAGEGFL
jgi:hypothetical protein